MEYAIKRSLVYLLLCFLVSCKGDDKNTDLKYLEIKYIPFGISFPIDRGDDRVRKAIPYIVKDKSIVRKVELLIDELQPAKKEYKSEEIYLRCILHYSNEKELILDYNKSDFRLDGTWYEGHPELISTIVSTIPESESL